MREHERLTIDDIAKEAGVSRATVSRVLNRRPDVSPATRAKILEIMEKRGFIPNFAAAALAGGRTTAIGLLIPRLEGGWATEVIIGVGEAAARHHRPLLLATTAYQEAIEEDWLRIFRSNLVAGVIVILATTTSGERLKTAMDGRIPLVLVDYEGHEAPFSRVEAANYIGTSYAIRHLIELGHRRIACIAGPPKYGCSRQRLAAYRDVICEEGLDWDPSLVIDGDFFEASGYEGTKRLLERFDGRGTRGTAHTDTRSDARSSEGLSHRLSKCPSDRLSNHSSNRPSHRPSDRPTAIFCSNDLMAFGCLRALREAGIRVPDDMSVVGFDDLPGADRTTPALTTVRQPLREMGRSAFELLLDQMARSRKGGSTSQPKVITLPTELVVRQSTGPPPS